MPRLPRLPCTDELNDKHAARLLMIAETPHPRAFQIRDWHADPALDSMSRDRMSTKRVPKTMQVLVCLAQRAGEVLSALCIAIVAGVAIAVCPIRT